MEEEITDKRRGSKREIEIESCVDNEKNLKFIKMIQRNVRKFLNIKHIKQIFTKADKQQNEVEIKNQICEKKVLKCQQNLDNILSSLPYEIWLDIFMFISSVKQVISISQVCHLFRDVCELNILWMPALKYNFPVVYHQQVKENHSFQKINWRALVKEKQIQLNGLREILNKLTSIKEEGNQLFKKKLFDQARNKYQIAMGIMAEYPICKYDDIMNLTVTIDHYKIIIILQSNLALMHFKLENYFKSRINAKEGLKKILEVQEIINQDETLKEDEQKELFKENFSLLKDKIIHRLKQVEEEMPYPFSFYHHSDVPVEELRVGSMLSHNNGAFSGGIFDDSKVLMITFNRDQSDITGIIINKHITIQRDGQSIRRLVGGPCEQNRAIILHNIPNVRGASRVIPGVWTGGDVSEYEGNPNYIINKYYGYASWFSGQLDGEIRNGNGWEHTNMVIPNDVFHPEENHEMDPYFL